MESASNCDESPCDAPCPAGVQAWARLVRAQSACMAAVETELRLANFPPLAWYDVLLELKTAPEQRLRPYELEERMLLRQYNLSRLLQRLEAEGLIVRQRCDKDARGQYVSITAGGRELLRRMWPVYAGAIKRHFAGKLAPGEPQELARLLGKLIGETST